MIIDVAEVNERVVRLQGTPYAFGQRELPQKQYVRELVRPQGRQQRCQLTVRQQTGAPPIGDGATLSHVGWIVVAVSRELFWGLCPAWAQCHTPLSARCWGGTRQMHATADKQNERNKQIYARVLHHSRPHICSQLHRSTDLSRTSCGAYRNAWYMVRQHGASDDGEDDRTSDIPAGAAVQHCRPQLPSAGTVTVK